MSSDGKLRVGTSGFHYNHWKTIFYPENLAKKKWFFHYAQHFDTVEINNTFTTCRRHRHSMPGKLRHPARCGSKTIRVLTADWTYLRFHGDHYAGTYAPQKLSAEAA
jgi:uncharacterized protein YecE (DUF72 family)